ncbi:MULTISPECIES: tetratricopeptide repeat protein [unclassified Treponema]|uniref:tetratricopeptide repeat protein n=1 Tax=unclassified Treponema TaxID=2638727 RepID=UPI0025E77DE5|nr:MULTISPECIES: tetratricopeptide repeat protein [unclassified Treponema]
MNKKNCFSFVIFFVFVSAVFSQASRPDALKLYREGKYKDAVAVCEVEISNNPNNMDSYAVLCWSLVGNKQYKEAELRATEARKINSYDIRLMEVLGEAKFYLGKNNEALGMFQRYVANSSETAARLGTAYYYMGEIYVRQTKYEHADISFSAAVKYEPTYSAHWWTRLGYAREMCGDFKNAITAYDRALGLNSQNYDAVRGKKRCQDRL